MPPARPQRSSGLRLGDSAAIPDSRTRARWPNDPQIPDTREASGRSSRRRQAVGEHRLFRPRACGRPAFRSGPARCSTRWPRCGPPAFSTREDFYWTLHAVFVKRHEHSILFDQAFRLFFRRRGYLEQMLAADAAGDGDAAADRAAQARRAAGAGGAVCRPARAGAGRAAGRDRHAAARCRIASCCSARTSRR